MYEGIQKGVNKDTIDDFILKAEKGGKDYGNCVKKCLDESANMRAEVLPLFGKYHLTVSG